MKKKDAILYAVVAQSAYTNRCNDGDFCITAKFDNKGTDTQGLMGVAYDNTFVIGFRGSEETGAADWVTDLKFIQQNYPYAPKGTSGVQVHYGFTEAYTSVRDVVLKAAKDTPHKQIVLVGHSLGGALATLAGLDIVENVPGKDVSVYTYGSPKVGDAAFADAYNTRVSNTYRVVNDTDLVPSIPLGNYYHVGKLLHLNPPNDNPEGIIAKITEKLEDHLPHNYIKALNTL